MRILLLLALHWAATRSETPYVVLPLPTAADLAYRGPVLLRAKRMHAHLMGTSGESSRVSDASPGVGALDGFCDALGALRESCKDTYPAAAKLLWRYFKNILDEPDNQRYRRVACSSKAYQRRLAGHASAPACFAAVGFEEEAEGTFVLAAAAPLLGEAVAHLEVELKEVELRPAWPASLQDCVSAACRTLLTQRPELLDALTEELGASHMPTLLEHADNLNRVRGSLEAGDIVAVEALVEQLGEIRKNATASGAGAAGSRVRDITSLEEWYDLLMTDYALLVADFKAAWCKPCKMIAPFFAELSQQPQYADVVFVTIDADALPVLVGENFVESFPTFKFFRDAEEADLPVVGADIREVAAKIDSLLGRTGNPF